MFFLISYSGGLTIFCTSFTLVSSINLLDNTVFVTIFLILIDSLLLIFLICYILLDLVQHFEDSEELPIFKEDFVKDTNIF